MMVTAVIALAAIALALGGYIAFDILHDNRSIKRSSVPEEAKPQETERVVENAAPKAGEDGSETERPQTTTLALAAQPEAAAPPKTETALGGAPDMAVEQAPQAAATNDESMVEEAPKASEATYGSQTEKKARRSHYKDPEIVFTEQVEKGRHKVEQKTEQSVKQKVDKPPAAKKTQNKPITEKKPTKTTAEKKTEIKSEPQAVESKAAEPQSAPKVQPRAKEEKNKIAQNISSPEAAAVIQRGDEAVETKRTAESKVFPPEEVRAEVAATEVDTIMSDEVAESLIEKSDVKTDRTKQGIINIDTLSACFESGDTVTLDEIKKRVKSFNKKTTYIKVLARGTLSKALTVEADSFSIQAVKMIILTGGKVIKKQ